MNFAYKTGGSGAAANNDITNCQVEAAQRVPQRQVSRTTASYTTPVQTSCNTIGTQTFCNSSGGDTIGGDNYTVDVNAGLRSKVFYQCMANKNYRYVNLPPCPNGVTLDNARGLLPLSNTTCYRVSPDGRSQVGNYWAQLSGLAWVMLRTATSPVQSRRSFRLPYKSKHSRHCRILSLWLSADLRCGLFKGPLWAVSDAAWLDWWWRCCGAAKVSNEPFT
jgi:hypothetical protein